MLLALLCYASRDVSLARSPGSYAMLNRDFACHPEGPENAFFIRIWAAKRVPRFFPGSVCATLSCARQDRAQHLNIGDGPKNLRLSSVPALGGVVPGEETVVFGQTFGPPPLLEAVTSKTKKAVLDICPISPTKQESDDGDISCARCFCVLPGFWRAGRPARYACLLLLGMLRETRG